MAENEAQTEVHPFKAVADAWKKHNARIEMYADTQRKRIVLAFNESEETPDVIFETVDYFSLYVKREDV